MAMSDSFVDRLGIHPIIQAPMAGVSTPRLAAAVSNAGALGSLGLGASTVDQARQMIRGTRALTDRPFNVNVFCHARAVRDAQREAAWLNYLEPLFHELEVEVPSGLKEIYPSFLDGSDVFHLLLEEKPAVVSFHFGVPPREQLQALHAAGIHTLATATSLREAELIEEAGVDAIIAQGVEAGGHRGVFDPEAADQRLSTAVLTRLLAGRVKRPVIATGGIMDGQGIRAMLDLGACAAQLGTAFILCPESNADAGYRAALKSDRAGITRLTSVFSGRPARGILNRFVSFGEAGCVQPAAYPLAYDAAKRLMGAAVKQGNSDFSAHWAGQGAPLARELPAGQLVAALIEELGPGASDGARGIA